MGHIFISYSHRDTDYAHRLADTLQTKGFDVWIDARLDYGSQWPHEIQKQLDACDAFILIMTPRAFASEWVQSELQRAKRKLKPIFPLLLEGDEPWLSVESTQYYDVREEKFPDEKFYSALQRVAERHEGQAVQLPAERGARPFKSKSSAAIPKIKTGILIAIIGAVALVLAAMIPLIWSNLSLSPTSAPTNNLASTPAVPSSTATIENATPDPGQTSTVSEIAPADTLESADFTDPRGVPMRLVRAGEFTMGDDADEGLEACRKYRFDCERSWYENEEPPHTVSLDAFYIDAYEVTNARYATCVDADACQPPNEAGSFTRDSYFRNPEYNDFPVVFVDWEDAVSYCQWRGMELPTEAQWEKAARGTDGRTYPWGEGIDEDYANYNNIVGDTKAVGSYESGRSPYGVYDMAGNVWEWVRDRYSATYYLGSLPMNPLGPDRGEYRVLRGGSWHNDGSIVRTSNRGWSQLEYFYGVIDFGFRCAMDGTP